MNFLSRVAHRVDLLDVLHSKRARERRRVVDAGRVPHQLECEGRVCRKRGCKTVRERRRSRCRAGAERVSKWFGTTSVLTDVGLAIRPSRLPVLSRCTRAGVLRSGSFRSAAARALSGVPVHVDLAGPIAPANWATGDG